MILRRKLPYLLDRARITRLALLLLLVVPTFDALLPHQACANGVEFAAEAEKMMRLKVDLDSVQERLQQPSPAAQAAGHAQSQGSPQAPLPLEPNSELDQVVVFRDRALVTRVLSAELKAGPGSVTFEGLPLGLAAESLNAQVRDGKVRIVGVEIVSGKGKVSETEQILKLREEMKQIAEELGQVRDRMESLLAQRSYLRSTLLSGGGADRPVPGLDQVKGSLLFVGQAEQEIASKLRAEQDKATLLDKKLQPILIQLDNPLATGKKVRVDYEVLKAGKSVFALRYQVFGARWWPTYNARLDESTRRVTLEYYGIVAQQTGESWQNAEVRLSTADASVSGDLPRLEGWVLGREYGSGYSVADNIEGGRGYYQAPSTQNPGAPVHLSEGRVSSDMSAAVQGSGTVVFAIPGRRTITGDGSEQRMPIGAETFGCDLEQATIPKLVPEVYRKARLRYEGQAPLLAGGVSSFVGNDYVGAGSISTVVPGEELKLAFGTDDQLKVVRQLVERQLETSGVGRKTIRYTFHFRIKVSNFSKEARTVMVTDQVPVSEVDKIEVAMLESTPFETADVADPPGTVRWKLEIPANGEKTLDLRFSVSAPRDRERELRALEMAF